MSQGSYRVIAENKNGDCTISTPFRSSIAAREFAIDEISKSPELEVSVVETLFTRQREASGFVHTGPEYGAGNGHKQIEHKAKTAAK